MQESQSQPQRRYWRYLLGLLQLAVGLILLVVLISQLPEDGIQNAVSQLPLQNLLLGLVLYSISNLLVTSFNWWYLLRALGTDVSLRNVTLANASGFFYSSIIPSVISGDVARAARLYRHAPQHAEIVLSLIIDRLIGLVVVVAVLTTGSLVYDEYLPFGLDRPLLLLGVLVGLGVLGLIGLYAIARYFPRLLAPYLNALRTYRQRPTALLVSTVLTMVIHVLIAGMLWFLARPFWGGALFFYCLFMIDMLNIAEMLPISISGLGVREGLYVLMLEPFGISSAEAISISLAQFGITLVVAMVGGVVEFSGIGLRLFRPR